MAGSWRVSRSARERSLAYGAGEAQPSGLADRQENAAEPVEPRLGWGWSPDGSSGPGTGNAEEPLQTPCFPHVQSSAGEGTAGVEFSTPVSVCLAVYTLM